MFNKCKLHTSRLWSTVFVVCCLLPSHVKQKAWADALFSTNDIECSIDMVISHFSEPADQTVALVLRAAEALPQATFRVYLFCQAGDILPRVLGMVPSDWNVTLLPNVNREAHAYLAYLRDHIRASSDFVWFTQAAPNGAKPHSLYLWSRLRHLSHRTGMLALCGVGATACDNWTDGVRILELFALTQRRFCTDADRWSVFFNGEFIVSRKRIRAQPAWLYDALWNASNTEDAYRRLDVRAAATSRLANYTFAFIMERGWNLVFGCLVPDYVPRKHLQDLMHRERYFQCLD